MRASIARLISDRSGNFGMITALLAVPITGAAGLAIDLTHALSLRTQLYAAADAAAVGAISPGSPAVAEAMAMQGDGTVTVGSADGQKVFLGQMSGELAGMPLDLEVTVSKTAGVIQSHVAFSAVMPTTFMKVLGRDSVAIGGTATARYQTPAFMDFYLLLDNTPSMGVAATPDDIAEMEFETRFGDENGQHTNCAFACHIVSESGEELASSYYNVARAKGITIRIDVVADATEALMETAAKTQTVKGQFRMAAYTFGQKAQDANLFQVAKLDENLSTVAAAAENITLMSIPHQGYKQDQLTSYDDAMTKIGDEIKGVAGEGTSAADRQKIVFFVADGVGDHAKSTGCTSPKGLVTGSSTRCVEPIDTAYCDALKSRNIRIAVLYTTYLPLPTNGFYRDWVAPFKDDIAARMQECASPGFYFEVSPDEGISDAMNALFHKIVSTPRITS